MIKLIVNKHTNTEVELTKVDNEIVMSVSTDVLVEDEWGPETSETSIVLPKAKAIELAKQLNMMAQDNGPQTS